MQQNDISNKFQFCSWNVPENRSQFYFLKFFGKMLPEIYPFVTNLLLEYVRKRKYFRNKKQKYFRNKFLKQFHLHCNILDNFGLICDMKHWSQKPEIFQQYYQYFLHWVMGNNTKDQIQHLRLGIIFNINYSYFKCL